MDVDKTKIQETADNIVEQLDDHVDVEKEGVVEKLDTLTDDYDVPLDEAERSVINNHIDDTDVDMSDIMGGQNDEVLVNEQEQDGEFVDIQVRVVELWEPQSDTVSQVGLVGDESGRNKFISFNHDHITLEEGESYRVENLVTDEFDGEIDLKFIESTEVTPLDEDVEVGENIEEISGVLVDMAPASGLIKRCPEEDCTRVLNEGRCSEHGTQESHDFDLRIKGTMDDGDETYTIIMNREVTEEFTGMTLEDARQLGKDELDLTVIRQRFMDEFLGKYYTLQTRPYVGNYMVDAVEKGIDVPDANTQLVEARSI